VLSPRIDPSRSAITGKKQDLPKRSPSERRWRRHSTGALHIKRPAAIETGTSNKFPDLRGKIAVLIRGGGRHRFEGGRSSVRRAGTFGACVTDWVEGWPSDSGEFGRNDAREHDNPEKISPEEFRNAGGIAKTGKVSGPWGREGGVEVRREEGARNFS